MTTIEAAPSAKLGGVAIERQAYPTLVMAQTATLREDPVAAAGWLVKNRSAVEDLLLESGAVMFRDFALPTAREFGAFISAFDDLPTGYSGGTSPRAVVTGKVMEATAAPADRELVLHQEMAYTRDFPPKIAFYCEQPAERGGETLIGPMRELTRRADGALIDRIRDRGVRHNRFFRDPEWYPGTDELAVLHRTWPDAFSTTDRSEAEKACVASGSECTWQRNGMRASVFSRGLVVHPKTGEEIWFNQLPAMAINAHSVGERFYSLYQTHYGPDDPYPYEVTYGDGQHFTREEVDALYPIIDDITVAPEWRQGDVMLLDNILTAHGRATYTGDRKIRVALLA